MDSTHDLYNIANEPVAILRKRHVVLVEGSHCAAFLLDQFYALTERRYLSSQYSDNNYNPYTTETLEGLKRDLFDLFDIDEIVKALNLLIQKQYIAVVESDKENNRYKLYINRNAIDKDSDAYTDRILKAQREKEAAWLAAHPQPKVAPQPTYTPAPYKQTLEQKYKTEWGRVEYHKKRALKEDMPATLTLEEWIETLEHFNWKCAYCGGKYQMLEHVIPLSMENKGTTANNCVPSCKKCNSTKGTYHPTAMPAYAHKQMDQQLKAVMEYLETRRSEELAS